MTASRISDAGSPRRLSGASPCSTASSSMASSTSDILSADASIPASPDDLGVDFILTGSLSLTSGCVGGGGAATKGERPSLRLGIGVQARVRAGQPHRGAQDIAASIARVLGQRYGVIFSHSRDNTGHVPGDFRHYRAVLDFYDYWRDFDSALYEPVRTALEVVVVEDPNFAEALACLSLLYTNAATLRIRRRRGSSALLDAPRNWRLKRSGSRRVRARPSSLRRSPAGSGRIWARGMASLKIAHDLNPNDGEILADLVSVMRFGWNGTRRCRLSSWPTGAIPTRPARIVSLCSSTTSPTGDTTRPSGSAVDRGEDGRLFTSRRRCRPGRTR